MKIDAEYVKDLLIPLVESLGFELVEVKAPVVGGRLILRIFVHSPRGVTLDDCVLISERVSDKLDTDDLIQSRYTLEVSSLGLDRPLFSLQDFKRRIGEKVQVTYHDGKSARVVEGVLQGCDGANINIELGDGTIAIPIEANPHGKIVI